MKYLKKLAELLFALISKDRILIGNRSFLRWRFLSNKLATSAEEKFLDDIYRAVLNLHPGAFIDVGVNTGQTLLKVLEIDHSREYVGFEAQIAPSFFVEQFLIDNQLKNIRIFPLALSNESSIVPLLIRGKSSVTSSASIVSGFRPDDFYTYSKFIYAVPGDDILYRLKLEKIAVVKIDVEGAELEVMQGMSNSIKEYQPFIVFEVLNHFLAISNQVLDAETIAFREKRIAQMEAFLHSHSYSIYQIYRQDEIRKVESIKPEKVADLSTTNYLAVPDSLESNLCAILEKTRRIQGHSGKPL